MNSEVYQLNQLAALARGQKPARLAVIGKPIAHSASPYLHQPALDAFGIQARYVRVEVEAGEVASALRHLSELHFIGCNITIPHKLEALAACHWVTDHARLLGAVNTVRFLANGHSEGHNTDGPGIVATMRRAPGIEPHGAAIVIIGAAGGAGRAIAAELAAHQPRQLTLANRSFEKLLPIKEQLLAHYPQLPLCVLELADPALGEACHAADLVIQASAVGLEDSGQMPIPASYLKPPTKLLETLYPQGGTALLRAAQAQGCIVADGKGMLLCQAALAFQTWFPDHPDPLPIMERVQL